MSISSIGRPQKQRFTTVLDRLQSSLRENLASYKAVYPSNRGQEKLADLENSIALLTSIVFFRLKVRVYFSLALSSSDSRFVFTFAIALFTNIVFFRLKVRVYFCQLTEREFCAIRVNRNR